MCIYSVSTRLLHRKMHRTLLTNSQCNRNWPCNNCAGSRAHLCRYDHTVKRCTASANRGPGELSPPSSSNSGSFRLIWPSEHIFLTEMADEYVEQSDSEILESLGYMAGGASHLAREVLGTSYATQFTLLLWRFILLSMMTDRTIIGPRTAFSFIHLVQAAYLMTHDEIRMLYLNCFQRGMLLTSLFSTFCRK